MTAMRNETSNETRLREDICRFGRSLFERGLTPGSSGNISVRLDGGGWLVTPTNASLGFLDPAKLYFKTRMAIGKWGATYAMPRSMYDYVHDYFCRME